MKFLTQSYNNGGSTYNAEAEETAVLSYRIQHRFNEPAEAWITLADPTGAIAAKYNDDANDVYIGAGKCTIEDPNTTDVFFGRIISAEARPNRTVEIYAQDWLCQLNDELITYDMREDLDGSGLRESTIRPYYDSGYTDNMQPAQGYLVYGVADDGGVQTDESAETQSAAANDMTLLPAICVANDAYYFGAYCPFNTLTLNVGTAGAGDWTLAWEYYNGGWVALAGVTDNTNDFKTAGSNTITYTMPTDWAVTGIEGYNVYWIRGRVEGVVVQTQQPLGTQATITTRSIIYENDLTWSQDDFNGMNLIFTDGMAGTNTFGTGPYYGYSDASTVNTYSNDLGDLWTDDSDCHTTSDVGGAYVVDYYFKVWVPDSSTWYSSRVAGTTKITMIYYGGNADATLQVYDFNAAGYENVESLVYTTGGDKKYLTVTIRDTLADQMFDSDGICRVRCDMSNVASNAITVYYINVEATWQTTGTSTAYAITDTLEHGIVTATDFTADATKVWDGLPYCVAREIYKHIDSAETPGTLITAGDSMETLTCAATIEHTSGISARQYVNKTRLEILQDLATQDKAELYIALGATTVNWKSTWGANSNTITDASVDSWTMDQDWSKTANEFNVYGMRIGDRQLSSNVNDATAQAKYNATRTRVVHDTGITSEYETNTRGTALVNQYKNVQKMLSATIYGFDTSYRLGTITEVTSADMGITAVDYIVNYWEYDSSNHISRIRLHPKVSTTGLVKDVMDKGTQTALDSYRKGPTEKYTAAPADSTITNP